MLFPRTKLVSCEIANATRRITKHTTDMAAQTASLFEILKSYWTAFSKNTIVCKKPQNIELNLKKWSVFLVILDYLQPKQNKLVPNLPDSSLQGSIGYN
jgi:hypothetical protein